MAGLQLQMLGDLEVIRGDTVLDLPPSRKTRGLLAYLALNERPMRREQLCELLWEIPDDPRGSLRWSLSKIRKLVDDEEHQRIVADRSTVSFDTSGVQIDVLALHRAAESVEEASVDELVRMAQRNQGAFLEGLDLPDFHDFHSWCIGERERTIRSQARVLRELGKRLAGEPERALEFALSLVSLTPFDESPRAELIRLLVQLERKQEAEQQYRVGLERLAEVGAADTGALRDALRPRPVPVKPATAGSRPSAPEPGLVGRDPELALLRERIGAIREQDRARVVLIRGEPGMGKSRLLQAAAAAARSADAGLLKASGFESEMIRPFGVWNDALKRALPGNATSELLSSGREVSREQVFASLLELLEAQTRQRPLVVLCDDVHWADESSVSAMHHVLRSRPRFPLLVVATSREVELRDNPHVQQVLRGLRGDGLLEELNLEPLSAAQVEELIRGLYPGADARALGRDSGGNPLLALELARAGTEGGTSLADLVEERMARFGEETRAILQWAAVLTPRIDVHGLERAARVARPEIDDALEQAEQQGLLHPGERGFRFAHELVRRCVYDAISPSRRRAMHRRVAELLEQDASVDLDLAVDLSHHARLSGDPLMAGKAMVSAGRLCLRFFANDDAMALYREGMAFAEQLNDAQRIGLTLELAEIRMTAAPVENWQAMVEELVSLAEQAMDHGSRPHARLGYQMASYLRWMHDEVQGAKRFSMQAERVSRGASDEAQVMGLAEAGKCLALLERDLSRADAMVMEARSLAERVGFDCAAIPLTRGILCYLQDQLEEAAEHLEDARALAKSLGDRLTEYMANEYLTAVEMERRDCAAAQVYATTLVEIGENLREGSERPFAECLRVLCQYGLTHDDTGLEPAMEALRLADAKQRLAFVLNRAAIQYLQHGELARARDCAVSALELARIMERPSEILLALVSLERVHRADGALAPDSHLAEIQALAAGSVAGWARKRSEELHE